jgi:hypothetical protein
VCVCVDSVSMYECDYVCVSVVYVLAAVSMSMWLRVSVYVVARWLQRACYHVASYAREGERENLRKKVYEER